VDKTFRSTVLHLHNTCLKLTYDVHDDINENIPIPNSSRPSLKAIIFRVN